MTQRKTGRLAIALWLATVLACLAVIARSHFTADLSAFLPRSPTPAQQLLVDQLRDGLASRLILVGIEGADAATRAEISLRMARQLRQQTAFASVANGEETASERDRAYLFDNRYLLSPAVTPEHFSVDGLHAAIGDSIDSLASPAGLLTKALLPRDPTGEMMQLLSELDSGNRPQTLHGAWASPDGETALLLAQTRAPGSDTDAQQQAMQAVEAAFDEAKRQLPAAATAQLRMTGPGVFSVMARDTIKSQVRIIFIVSTLLIAVLLLAAYRSFAALVLGFLPVASGIAAGVAAVSLAFGVVHGITLGFGTALIGEAVDYSIYLFMQAERGAAGQRSWLMRVWPTIRLGVLTSICGFAALLLSGFPGLAQLGLYSIAGLTAAALMTRYVLPHLLPANFQVRDLSALGRKLAGCAQHAGRLRRFAIVLPALACVVLYLHRDTLWNHELAALSPVPAAAQALDTRLRTAIGAPDARYIVVAGGASEQAALRAAEKVSAALQPLVQQGALAHVETPSRYLPSVELQRLRQASLPAPDALAARLAQASASLPVKPALFAPFLADVEAARTRPLLQSTDLAGTSMALAVDGMLIHGERGWHALLPLTAPAEGIDGGSVRTAIAGTGAIFIDLKAETDRLYMGYLHEAIVLSLAGVAAIVALLFFALRSPTRVLRVVLPLAAAVLVVTAALALGGIQLILLHLIGLLLVVAIGSNYALFFVQADDDATLSPRTYASLLFANVATVLGFGLLAFSSVPVLQALGMTVAPGVILALLFAAAFAAPPSIKASHG